MKKRKLRRLAIKSKQTKFNQLKNIGITVTICFIGGILSIYYSPTILDDFLLHYNLHYNLIVHGNSDYCNVKILNSEKLFAEVKKDVLNQNEAMLELQNLFKNNTKILTPIAIIGSSGIGKTMLANKILINFPWSDNVKYFKWSIYEEDNIKYRKLLRFINRLSDCGQTLLIIDDLSLDNMEMIKKINEYVLKKSTILTNNTNRLILIYIFNLSRFINDENYNVDLINFKLQISNKIKTVILRNFNRKDLDDCIKNEMKELNVNLNKEEFNDIRNSIDVNRSGCKNVNAKVKMFEFKETLL